MSAVIRFGGVTSDEIADDTIADVDIDATSGLGIYLAKRTANAGGTDQFDNVLANLPHAAAVRTWDPSFSSDCKGWWVPDENTTRVSGAVSNIPNRVTSGLNPLVQSTAGSRPTYTAAGWMDVQPTFTGDGTADYLTADGIAAHVTGTDLPFTIVFAVEIHALADTVFMSFGKSTVDTQYMQIYMDAGGNVDVFRKDDSGAAGVLAQAAVTTGKKVISVIFSGTTVTIRINGSVITNAAAMNVGAMTVDRFTVGARGRTDYASFSAAEFGEIAFFSAALTATQATRVENLFMSHYPVE